jgi:RNA-directed DNA polymerase
LRKFGHKLLITPAKSKVQSLRQEIKRLIQSALGLSPEALLRQLNPLLRGWANYFRNGAAERTFIGLSYYVHDQLWRWVSRRHPKKTQAWKHHQYFSAAGQPRRFSIKAQRIEGESHMLKLYQLASTKIARHIRVRGAANPYDPNCTEYFAQRRCFAWRVLGSTRKDSAAPLPT